MQTTWQFFCLKSDLQQDRDFVVESIAGIPVVVQNVKGELKAFHNVCSHRYSPLQTAESGSRQLFCPYHGWVYDAKGVPVGVPHNAEYYPITLVESKDLALRSFRVQLCGNLVFVSLSDCGTLEQQLGESFALLKKIGSGLDDIYFQTRIPTKCNWKFLIHNAFDDIHAQFVHPSSSLDTSGYLGSRWSFNHYGGQAEDVSHNYSKRHALFEVDMDEATRKRNESIWGGLLANRAYAFDEYIHFFMFPNILITSVQGLWYNIVRYQPSTAESSDLTYWLIPGRPSVATPAVTPEVLYSLALSSLKIFEEDIRAVEVGQGSIRSVQHPGKLGRREDKIVAFEAAYVDRMAASTTSAG